MKVTLKFMLQNSLDRKMSLLKVKSYMYIEMWVSWYQLKYHSFIHANQNMIF